MSRYPDNPHWHQIDDKPLSILTEHEWAEAEASGWITPEHVIDRLWRIMVYAFEISGPAAFDENGWCTALIAESVAFEYGIKVYVYPNDHPEPHAHIKIQGDGAADIKISLLTGEVISNGTVLPKGFNTKRLNGVVNLVLTRHDELASLWESYHGELPQLVLEQ